MTAIHSVQDLASSPLAQRLGAELGSLLEPIEAGNPAGPSLRYDPLYDQVRKARRTESDTLPQGVWQRDLQHADWGLIDQLTTDALERRSKDLQLAVWRTEALLHAHGLPGFTGGCQLILGLHTHFALSMHPAPAAAVDSLPLDPEDAGIEGRLNLIQWLNEKLSVQLKLLPMTAPEELSGALGYTLADLENARLLEQTDRKAAGAGQENKVRLFEQSLALTPMPWLQERWSELQHATEVTFLLDDVLDLVYGSANGGLLRIKESLQHMTTIFANALPDQDRPLAAGQLPAQAESGEFAPGELASTHAYADVPAAEGAVLSATAFQIRNREEAYRRLAEIADFLSRLEPHSPVPYLIERAISWGAMSLEELLPELLADQAAVKDVSSLLRLKGSVRR